MILYNFDQKLGTPNAYDYAIVSFCTLSMCLLRNFDEMLDQV